MLLMSLRSEWRTATGFGMVTARCHSRRLEEASMKAEVSCHIRFGLYHPRVVEVGVEQHGVLLMHYCKPASRFLVGCMLKISQHLKPT
jgi:hypothetical protein